MDSGAFGLTFKSFNNKSKSITRDSPLLKTTEMDRFSIQTIYQKKPYKSAAYKQALDAVMRNHTEESNLILFLCGLKK